MVKARSITDPWIRIPLELTQTALLVYYNDTCLLAMAKHI